MNSYPSIYNLGHRYIKDLLLDPVLVEEKIDGSQISFGLFPGPEMNGPELKIRSKGAEINILAPDRMFAKAVEFIKSIEDKLTPGWTYRGEYLSKPKHNTLAYDRAPDNHIIIFDIEVASESDYCSYYKKTAEAKQLGLETVPMLHCGKIEDYSTFRSFLDRESILGGQKIEGVVIKNYQRFGIDHKILIGKFVSEAFKEVHGNEWRKEHPTSNDIIETLKARYRTPARWAKAVQHLRDKGLITDSPKDIGLLIKEVPEDVLIECGPDIQKALWDYAWPKIARGLHAGLPEWWKEELAKKQFDTEEG